MSLCNFSPVPKLQLFVLLLLACGPGISETIVSTFASDANIPPDGFLDCCAEGVVAPYQIAYPFLIPTTSNFTFESATLALAKGIGNVNGVDISLATDASNQPGTVLETFDLVGALGQFGANNPPIVVDSLLDPLLLAGAQYWLIVTPSAPGNGVNWLTATIAPNPSEIAINDGNGSWSVESTSDDDDPGAFSISGMAVPISAVPEPGSGTLLSVTTLTLCALRRKFQQTVKAAVARKLKDPQGPVIWESHPYPSVCLTPYRPPTPLNRRSSKLGGRSRRFPQP
jgi:hypothetical protein